MTCKDQRHMEIDQQMAAELEKAQSIEGIQGMIERAGIRDKFARMHCDLERGNIK